METKQGIFIERIERLVEGMRKDYQFLIGQRFSVGGEIYVVRDLTFQDEFTYVQAEAENTVDIVLSEPCTQEQRGTQGGDRIFRLNEVIQSLLVDEEIELFNPNYLAAR
jgi:hypothetical protein